MKTFKGSLVIKNMSDEPYSIEEMGGFVLEPKNAIDLLNNSSPNKYDDYKTASRLCKTLTTAKLYRDILADIIRIITDIPPLDR